MTKDTVKKEIEKKFGTFTRFAKMAGIDHYDLQRDFLNKKYITSDKLKEIKALIRETENKALKNDLTAEKIELLRIKIDEKGGPYKFCKDHPEFVMASVYQVLAGKYKKISGRVKVLFDHFKIK